MKHLKSDFPEVDFKAEFCDERIYLSPLSTDDVTERYHSWLVDQKVNAFLEVRGNELTLDDIREYITQGPASGAYYMYAIRTLDTDLHIGNVKIGPIQWTHRVADLPVIIGDREFWGKGIATEAIRLGNRLAFEFYDLRKLQGQIYRGNVGSIKAYCRAGWIIEGVVRGRYLVDGKPMDQVIVSCNNSNYIPAQHDDYSIDTLRELIDFRNTL
jgi:RimJ/RimL family protein N-acetyltransferase